MVNKVRKKKVVGGGGNTSILGKLGGALASLNNSKFFAGIVMIMMNIGSKYISIKLTKSQEHLRTSLLLLGMTAVKRSQKIN